MEQPKLARPAAVQAPVDLLDGVPPSTLAGSPDDLIALLGLTRLDDEIARMLGALREVVGRLDQERADLAAFGELVSTDRAAIADVAVERQGSPRQRERLSHNQKAYAAQASVFAREQREAMDLSSEIQRRMVEADERRQTLLASISREILARYEAAERVGARPALIPEKTGRCPACGTSLGPSRELVSAGRVVGCRVCPHLVYDPAWARQAFVTPARRPVAKARR